MIPIMSLKLIYSEKTTKLYEISTVDLTVTTWDKSTVEILQNFVAFSEYMNFTGKKCNGILEMQEMRKIWHIFVEYLDSYHRGIQSTLELGQVAAPYMIQGIFTPKARSLDALQPYQSKYLYTFVCTSKAGSRMMYAH